jgi:hypothetical protein
MLERQGLYYLLGRRRKKKGKKALSVQRHLHGVLPLPLPVVSLHLPGLYLLSVALAAV